MPFDKTFFSLQRGELTEKMQLSFQLINLTE